MMRRLAFEARRALVGLAALFAGCEGAARTDFPMPGRLVQALTVAEDLEATATLVPRGGAPLAPVALGRGDDGVSFSGFLPAEPGEYTLRIVFTGVPAGGGARLFLGRWTSDAFTVTLGDAATPIFSAPLDVIGAPDDGGDLDADGLGNLDELLLGTAPDAADSDMDGLPDGEDCDPARAEAEPFRILAGGSARDCDGDGAARPDPAFGAPGMDCDDRAADVSPAAEDDCDTPVDEDCNPATCPSSDVEPPTLVAWTPADGATLGCHARLAATLEDEGRVSAAQFVLEGVDGGRDATLFAREDGGVFTSGPLNGVAGSEGLDPGPFTVRLEAADAAGNPLVVSRAYTLELAVPRVTAMTPTSIGGASAPLEVVVEAQADLPIAEIELYRVKRSALGGYDLSRAERVGGASSSPARFTVDPGGLADGEHLLFPVVRDAVGNEARPSLAVVPVPGPSGLEVDSDYRCIASSAHPKIPARVLVVGEADFAPVKMRDLLPRALAEAEAVAPGTELVQINAFGLAPDGTVALDDATSFSKRWVFGFRHPSTGDYVSVSWFTPALTTTNPVVDPDAGNIVSEVPFVDVAGLADSDAVSSALAAQGQCPALTGDDEDAAIYQNQGGQDVVLVTAGGSTWRGTASGAVTELDDCP